MFRVLKKGSQGLALVSAHALWYNFFGNNEISPLCKEWGNPLFIFGI
jgi:hypothetical protein